MGTLSQGSSDKSGGKVVVTLLPIPRDFVECPSDATQDELEGLVGGFAALCVEEGRLRKITLTISGYDNDPRELYEIPEVCAWARNTFRQLPSLLFFLDDASMDRFVGWLCGPVSRKDIESPKFLERFRDTRMKCVVASTAASSDFLERAGASKELISEFYFQGIREYAAAQGSIREYAAAQGSIREYAAAQGRQKKWWQFWKRESESIQRPASQPRHPTFAGAARLATPKACPKSTPSVRTVYCPNCQKQVVWVEHLKGKQVSCYLCGKAFKMPE